MSTESGESPKSKKQTVKVNMKGPITILGCAAQGCEEFVFEGELAGDAVEATSKPSNQ